jgi:hypothetical protein
MNHPNIHITRNTGSKNYIIPNILKLSYPSRVFAWMFRYVPEPTIVYNIYVKSIFHGHSEVKKGDVYLDKSSCIKLVVLKVSLYPKTQRTIQFCTLIPLNKKDSGKINFPLLLKYLGSSV